MAEDTRIGIRYRDLPATDRHHREVPKAGGGTYHVSGPPISLFCSTCGEHFSATRGDYFLQDQDAIAKHCGRPLRLVQLRAELVALSPEQARELVQYG